MTAADLHTAKTEVYACGTKAPRCSHTQGGGITPKEYFVQI